MNIPKLQKLQTFTTGEGEMVPIYKDWEDWHSGYIPKMAYITSIAPNTSKGPILHLKRRGFMMAFRGEVVVECLVGGEIRKYELRNSENEKYVLMIPAGTPNKICNLAKEEAIILNLPDRAWRPDDEDTEKFNDWEDYYGKT